MHRKLKYFLRICYCSALVCGSIVAVLFPRSTDTSIAAYDRYVTPTWKTTQYFSPQYAYRFYPSKHVQQSFMISHIVHKRLSINRTQTNPKLRTAINHVNTLRIAVTHQRNIVNHDKQTQLKNKKTKHYKKPSWLQRIFRIKTRQQKDAQTLHTKEKQLSIAKQHLAKMPRVLRMRKSKRYQYHIMLPPKYHIQNDTGKKLVYLNYNYPIWKTPYRPGLTYISSTNRLAHDSQAMIILKRATFRHHTFYLVESSRNTYGWVVKDAIRPAHSYLLPFQYYSQLYPKYAPDACEVVALRMALSVKGYDPDISMTKYINRVPRSHNPNHGYNASPYKMGDSASIYPKALAAYGRRYDNHVYAFTGITKHRVIYEIEHGNPVVFEGAYRMRVLDSDHTLVLIGYSHGDLEFADPFCRKSDLVNNKPISWVSMPKFEHMFHQSFRGARAVVVK